MSNPQAGEEWKQIGSQRVCKVVEIYSPYSGVVHDRIRYRFVGDTNLYNSSLDYFTNEFRLCTVTVTKPSNTNITSPQIGSVWVHWAGSECEVTSVDFINGICMISYTLDDANQTEMATELPGFHKDFILKVTQVPSTLSSTLPAVNSEWENKRSGKACRVTMSFADQQGQTRVQYKFVGDYSAYDCSLTEFIQNFTPFVKKIKVPPKLTIGSKWQISPGVEYTIESFTDEHGFIHSDLNGTIKEVNVRNCLTLNMSSRDLSLFLANFTPFTSDMYGHTEMEGVEVEGIEELYEGPCQHKEWGDLVMLNEILYTCKKCGKTKEEV